ncbi:MAG: hypothetical protein JXB26_13750 [Candidatus Aminicenantes bacterium]|nr:hypothetical protein [Candidatus Aminicenantes bacterium]
MPFIMILYYIICVYLISMVVWNFIREKKNPEYFFHYLLVLIPLILRVLRVK